MARQNISQENGKRFTTTATTKAIGTKNPLASTQETAIVFGWIVAVKKTVPVQRLMLAAAGTALLFERKSSCLSFSGSPTKRKGCAMGMLLSEEKRRVEEFLTALRTTELGA